MGGAFFKNSVRHDDIPVKEVVEDRAKFKSEPKPFRLKKI
jgi:hypothetical protein